jgi:hypothetical protein
MLRSDAVLLQQLVSEDVRTKYLEVEVTQQTKNDGGCAPSAQSRQHFLCAQREEREQREKLASIERKMRDLYSPTNLTKSE